MTDERVLLFTCFDIPQQHCPVMTPTGERHAIRTECYALDPTGMPDERPLGSHVTTSHNRTIFLKLPLARVFPSGLNAIQ